MKIFKLVYYCPLELDEMVCKLVRYSPIISAYNIQHKPRE